MASFGLDSLPEKLPGGGREEAPWPLTAAILTIARFCEPQSELHIENTWHRRTALEDLLGVEVKLAPGPDGDETFLLARSADRREASSG